MAEYIANPFTGRRMRVPLINGMDPGAARGYAIVDPEDIVERRNLSAPRVLAIGTQLVDVLHAIDAKRPLWHIVEFQYTSRVTSGEISAESIVKLAFRAGFMLRDAMADAKTECVIDQFAAVPRQWKAEIWRGGATLRKDVFCERIRRQLTPKEVAQFSAINHNNHHDVLDAIGIAWALWFAAQDAAKLRSWHVTHDRIIPLRARKKAGGGFMKGPIGERQRAAREALMREVWSENE